MPSRTEYRLPDGRPHVMGILNITPDSFSDGGRYTTLELALEHARELAAEGADILDIGAESTRPGSQVVTQDEEWRRLEPVIGEVVGLGLPVSVDTYKAEIAKRSCALGVSIINDVWGLQKDPAMADVVAEAEAFVVMMHNGEDADHERDIMADMDRWFERSMELARKAGIPEEKQILDPGFGFAKTMNQNYEVLNRMEELNKHGLPVLVGASRKRMIGAVLNNSPDERLYGSLAVHLLAMQKGAAIVRVHEVHPHLDTARILYATLQEKVPE